MCGVSIFSNCDIVLPKQNRDIFDDPLILVQHLRTHRPLRDDVAPLAAVLRSPPYGLEHPLYEQKMDLSKPGWFEVRRDTDRPLLRPRNYVEEKIHKESFGVLRGICFCKNLKYQFF